MEEFATEEAEKVSVNAVRPYFEIEVSSNRVFARVGAATATIENCSDVMRLRKALARMVIEHAQFAGEMSGDSVGLTGSGSIIAAAKRRVGYFQD